MSNKTESTTQHHIKVELLKDTRNRIKWYVVLGKNVVYKDLAMGQTGVYKQHILDTGANSKAKCCEGGSEAKVV